MHLSLATYLILSAAALLGGAINSIAGGGTLLTFPALLAIIGPVAANATSTVALLPASFGGGWAYRRELASTRRMLAILFIPSLVGGVLGSLAVTRLPARVFENLVPWLLVTASTLMLLQRPIARWIGSHPHEQPRGGTVAAIVFFQLLVGLYGGYFGAGIGILMLSSLSFMGIRSIHEMNALKTTLSGLINGVSVVVFVLSGVVVWQLAIVMAMSAILGGYLGARWARTLHPQRVRIIVIVIGFAVAGYTFYRRFAH